MSELLEELCERLRFMVEHHGHNIDDSYDRTTRLLHTTARRWICGEWHAKVRKSDGMLSLVWWSVSGPMLHQTGSGMISNRQLSSEEAAQLLIMLRGKMVLEELSDV